MSKQVQKTNIYIYIYMELFVVSIENLEKHEISYILEKILFLSIIAVSEKYLKKKNKLRYQKFFILIEINSYFKNMGEKKMNRKFR